jgi:hypothetical protein
MQWIRDLVVDAGRARESQRQHDLAEQRAEQLVRDGAAPFWGDFIGEVRRCVTAFNAAVDADDRVIVVQDEAAFMALRRDGARGGQFVAKFLVDERQGEVALVLGRSITVVNCPIALRDSTDTLAFQTTSGDFHNCEDAARLLLGAYFRFILGIEEPPRQEGRRSIGFGSEVSHAN